MSIADNIKRVREAVFDAAEKSGRAGEDITIVAAAKTNSAASVREAIGAGIDAVGENRVQEMLEKHAQGAYTGAPLHFIGRLQSNKAGKAVGVCDLIESVDSEPLLELIGKKARALGICQNVLIEVNIGSEPNKSGVLPEKTAEILDFASEIKDVSVLGLMAIPPVFGGSGGNFHYFDAMFKLFIDMRGKKYDNVSMRLLSMGMSDSFAEAVRAGANMVRIGSAIFGARY